MSFFIEFFQLFIQIRNTATHDLINNTLGGLIGALCAAVYAVKISSISRKIFYNLLGNQPFLLTVVIIGLFQSVSAMMPFTVSITVSDLKRSIKTTNIMPLGHQSVERLLFNPSGKGSGSSFDFISFVEDLIFWAVTGYLLMLCYRRYWQHKPYGKILLVGLPIVYFPLMEFSQLFITSRYTDINDVISGYLGIATGMILYFLTRSMLRKGHRINLDLLKVPLLTYGMFILYSGLQPFDWTSSFSPALKMDTLIPFYTYFREISLWNIYNLIRGFLLFVPISLYWTYRLRQKQYDWERIYFMTTASGFLLGVLIEVPQIFSLSRVVGITDVVTYGLGGTIGTFLIYYYERQIQPLLGINRDDDLEFVSANRMDESSP
jgi:glycopeptide antibiotics resistance protein